MAVREEDTERRRRLRQISPFANRPVSAADQDLINQAQMLDRAETAQRNAAAMAEAQENAAPAAGSGRRRRAGAGPNDGRRKRAEIVKRVMAERGVSMIEASKYVKAHGLY